MGTDKATLVVDGVAMAQRLRGVLVNAGIDEIIEAGSAECPDDTTERQGPMAGIVSGWRHLQHVAARGADPVVVLSCDLPRIQAITISELLQVATEHRHGAVAHDGERPQPLIAAYRPAALQEFERAYGAGERSVRRCFPNLDVGRVDCDPTEIADADTPSDLVQHDVLWPTKHS